MVTVRRCPACGGEELRAAAGSRLRCNGCGATLAWETPWAATILAWAVVGALLGAASAVLFRDVLVWDSPARWLIVFPIVAVVAHLISRRFRRLRQG